jgi:hypothetical protein
MFRSTERSMLYSPWTSVAATVFIVTLAITPGHSGPAGFAAVAAGGLIGEVFTGKHGWLRLQTTAAAVGLVTLLAI